MPSVLLHHGLVHLFNNPQPHISVLGLNPHAGESGKIGTEEQTWMIPLIKQLQQQGISCLWSGIRGYGFHARK